MRRGRLLIIVGLILVLGLVAVVVVLQRFSGGATEVVDAPVVIETPVTTNVLITTQRVSRGTEITEDMVQLVSIPEDNLIDGMIQETVEAVGQRARFDMEAQVYLTRGMLAATAEQLSAAGSDAALLIPRGMVAVSIPIDRLTSMGYGIQRGDHVNVIATLLFVDMDANFQSLTPNSTSAIIAPGATVFNSGTGPDTGEEGATQDASPSLQSDPLLQNLTAQSVSGGTVSPIGRIELDPTIGQPFYVVASERQRPRLVSQNIIQDVVVLNVGDFDLTEDDPAANIEPVVNEDGVVQDDVATVQATEVVEVVPPDIITLVVSPQDAVTLNYLVYHGAQLSLALRSAQDDSRIQTEAVTLQFLLDQYLIPVPAKLPFGLEPRLDVITPPTLGNDEVPPVEP